MQLFPSIISPRHLIKAPSVRRRQLPSGVGGSHSNDTLCEKGCVSYSVFDIQLLSDVELFYWQDHFCTGISDIEKEYKMKGKRVYINEPPVSCSIFLTLAAVQALATLISSDRTFCRRLNSMRYMMSIQTETR